MMPEAFGTEQVSLAKLSPLLKLDQGPEVWWNEIVTHLCQGDVLRFIGGDPMVCSRKDNFCLSKRIDIPTANQDVIVCGDGIFGGSQVF